MNASQGSLCGIKPEQFQGNTEKEANAGISKRKEHKAVAWLGGIAGATGRMRFRKRRRRRRRRGTEVEELIMALLLDV